MNNSEFIRNTLLALACWCLLAVPSLAQETSESKGAAQETKEKVVQAAEQESPQKIEESDLGETKNVHRAGDLFFAGQFTQADLDVIKENEIARIITLRTDGEIDWDEESITKEAGLEFIKVPFRSEESLTNEVFDTIRELLRDESKKTLFHCGSANRVGGVWLPYRVLDQGVDLETALEEAKEIGLRTPFIQERAIEYIALQQKLSLEKEALEASAKESEKGEMKRGGGGDQVMNGEASVRPGINETFLDPETDADQWVERFEMESREIYVARQRILAACQIQEGDVVADVGAGTGFFSRLFSVEVGKEGWVYSVDISPRLIEHINREATRLEISNSTCVLCAQNSINLPPNSTDVVFICDTYHHFEFPKSTLASIHKAMKPGGRMILIDFDRIPGESREWLLDHVRADKATFRDEVINAGFRFVEEKEIAGFEENYFLVFEK